MGKDVGGDVGGNVGGEQDEREGMMASRKASVRESEDRGRRMVGLVWRGAGQVASGEL